MIPGRSQGAERFGDVPEGQREACPKGPKVLGLPGGRAVSQAEGREQGDHAAGRRLALAVGCYGCGCRTGSVGHPRCFAGLKKRGARERWHISPGAGSADLHLQSRESRHRASPSSRPPPGIGAGGRMQKNYRERA